MSLSRPRHREIAFEKYARSRVSEAIKLTRWLHAQQLELRDVRQDLLDA